MDTMEGHLPSYVVYQFRNGDTRRSFESEKSPLAVFAYLRRYGQLGKGITAIIKTELSLKPRSRSRRRLLLPVSVTHSMAQYERDQPNTLFVSVIDFDTFKEMCRAADEEWERREAAIQMRIAEVANPQQQEFSLKDLPDSWAPRVSVLKAGPNAACWFWRTGKNAPYRDTYLRLKGPIPEGAIVRHRCDNRRCVNPNHLELGSAADNVNDMWQRGRAYWQRC